MLDLASAMAGGWTAHVDDPEPYDHLEPAGIVSGVDLSPLDECEVLDALGLDADEG